MMLYSVHGARIVNLVLDFITPLVARYRKVFFSLAYLSKFLLAF